MPAAIEHRRRPLLRRQVNRKRGSKDGVLCARTVRMGIKALSQVIQLAAVTHAPKEPPRDVADAQYRAGELIRQITIAFEPAFITIANGFRHGIEDCDVMAAGKMFRKSVRGYSRDRYEVFSKKPAEFAAPGLQQPGGARLKRRRAQRLMSGVLPGAKVEHAQSGFWHGLILTPES